MNIERNHDHKSSGQPAGSQSSEQPSTARPPVGQPSADQPSVERLLAERLTEGEPELADPREEAVKRLPPRWEIRIQTERDPIAEETAWFRSIAKEVDDRYDNKSKP